ncbi:universal stress protein [Nitrosospira sp. Is2]|uniref:universal stress protein n=1 Tax=Nitrosospira sp. Is2 TaxID=3080532 RepID=UPI002955B4A8|nr:universal stress protein [Nitrosospira sp. Is2]WON72732.1 universal stress protein [Nitrosospira sp. Is2]
MLRFLFPVDGSDASNRAITEFIARLDWYRHIPEIHLLNVQFPQRGNVPLFIDKESIDRYHREEGLKELQAARELLDRAGLVCHYHIAVGNPPDVIMQYGKEIGCDQIVMGPRGLGAVKRILLGSVASKVIELSTIPVLLIR